MVRLLTISGRTLFRLGRHEAARRRFERVLELRGDHFTAYVHLGRIAYKLGDYAGWREQCAHARRTAPERFARLRHPFELFEPRTGWSLGSSREPATIGRGRGSANPTGLGSRAPGTSVGLGEPGLGDAGLGNSGLGSSGLGSSGIAGDATLVDEPGRTPEPTERRIQGVRWSDDFVDGAERRKFRELEPIEPAEMRACDLDDLARRLTES